MLVIENETLKTNKQKTTQKPNKTPQLLIIIFYKQQHKFQTALCFLPKDVFISKQILLFLHTFQTLMTVFTFYCVFCILILHISSFYCLLYLPEYNTAMSGII